MTKIHMLRIASLIVLLLQYGAARQDIDDLQNVLILACNLASMEWASGCKKLQLRSLTRITAGTVGKLEAFNRTSPGSKMCSAACNAGVGSGNGDSSESNPIRETEEFSE